jgi:hypothetical protein
MCVGGTRERKGAVYDWFQANPAVEPLEPMLAETTHHGMFFVLRARLHHRSFDLQMTVKDLLQFDCHLTTATENTDLDQPTTVGERCHIAREIRRAHEVDHDVDAPTVRGLRDDFGEILAAVVDDFVRSQLHDAF